MWLTDEQRKTASDIAEYLDDLGEVEDIIDTIEDGTTPALGATVGYVVIDATMDAHVLGQTLDSYRRILDEIETERRAVEDQGGDAEYVLHSWDLAERLAGQDTMAQVPGLTNVTVPEITSYAYPSLGKFLADTQRTRDDVVLYPLANL